MPAGPRREEDERYIHRLEFGGGRTPVSAYRAMSRLDNPRAIATE
jgi:hypothetical protein